MVGGLAGSFAVLAGAAAVDPAPQAAPLILAVVLFLWTPPHFWSLAAARRDDYAAAAVPMLPVTAPKRAWTLAILLHTAALAILSLVPLYFGLGPDLRRRGGIGRRLFPLAQLAALPRAEPHGGDAQLRRVAGPALCRWSSASSSMEPFG